MLRTRERTLLLESLRPPSGYQLNRAIGTSYTLDLLALLTAPLAFTFFDVHDDEGSPTADPLALLEALRRHAEKIKFFCQSGAISLPRPEQSLLAFLEGSVIEARAPIPDGLFHPKVWVMEFVREGVPTIYRLLCLSRNLTFDRAWDTCLSLEGRLTARKRGYNRNRPIADFLLALPKLAARPLPKVLSEDLQRIAAEIRRVDFNPPEPFEDFSIHPLGLSPGASWPFPKARRSLVVSPYLAGSTVERLLREHGLEVLISRPEAIDRVVADRGHSLPEHSFVLSRGADLDAREMDEGEMRPAPYDETPVRDAPELSGLHAKLFLGEEGSVAHLFTGSANATQAAFGLNVELLVDLMGPTRLCGIDALLGDTDDPREDTFRSLLQPYRPEHVESLDEDDASLERRLDRLAADLGSARLTAVASSSDDGHRWNVELVGDLAHLPGGVGVRTWPVTLSAEHAQPIDHSGAEVLAAFEGVSFEALTAFFAFEVSVKEGATEASRRFTVTVGLEGVPEDRRERLLRLYLKDSRQVLRLLLLLLMDEGADVSAFVSASHDSEGAPLGPFGGRSEATLLEALLRSLDTSPDRIDHVERLIADLSKTPEGRALLPAGLQAIWEPIRTVREELLG